MNKIIHKSSTRGHADHGWLNAHHTFSFANYHDPARVHFGMLRVLNDDIVDSGMGFGTHPHDNMEIVTIPISGSLEHRDNTGRHEIIRSGDVQIMSAGTGIAHSEMNPSKTEAVNLLQIWVFPKQQDITPRYEQKTYPPEKRNNKLLLVVSPEKNSDSLWINQDAWFSLGKFDKDKSITYDLHKENSGVYIFIINGEVEVEGDLLQNRDGMGITSTISINIKCTLPSEFLLMEIPMQ